MSLGQPHSLRSRLLWSLLAAIVAVALVQAFVVYRTTRTEADELFDYHMQRMAMSLRPGLPSSGPGGALGGEPGEEIFDFMVQIWSADGLSVFRSTSRATLPQRAVLGFSNVEAHGTTYRVFSMQTRSQVIQVAQDMAVRREMAGTMALRTVGPIAVAAPLLMLVVWWVVSGSLAPVSRLRRQLAERQADDLSEVSEPGLPGEIRPLVDELNLLFGRVRQAFEAQKAFVADAAHELRSPLAALKLQAQALQRAPHDAARGLAVARLEAGIDRAVRLVEQLMVLARLQSDSSAQHRPAPVTLAEIARLEIADAAPAAKARRIDLGLEQADEGRVSGHAEALRILVRNLLDNAHQVHPGRWAGGCRDPTRGRSTGAAGRGQRSWHRGR